MIAGEATPISPGARAAVPDAAMIARYNRPGPRYTSYPPAPYWSPAYAANEYAGALGEAGAAIAPGGGPAFSLYVHIPFCERRCTFCACNVVISREHSRGRAYIERLAREMDLVLDSMAAPGGSRPRITQMHWGGGTPTWLSADELDELAGVVAERFEMLPDREQSIEVDPRVTTPEQLDVLRARGLNRVSMGVQDFDSQVQRAVNRVQSRGQTEALIQHARRIGIAGVNVDLIYGLPHQSVESFVRTVDEVVEMGVDRIALYNFAWLPTSHTRHKAIPPELLPPPEVRIEIFRAAAERFTRAGYIMIGLDHFARRDDELALAMQDGTLQRNFMGYTTRGSAGMRGTPGSPATPAGSGDLPSWVPSAGHPGGLIAFGVSSISRIGRDFAQNVKTTSEYQALVDAGRLPVQRGLRLSDDDLVREYLIQRLMCFGVVDFADVLQRFGVDLLTAEVQEHLREFVDDGLVEWDSRDGIHPRLVVMPMGRYFLRNIAMVFDAYSGRPVQEPQNEQESRPIQVRFSRTV